MMPENPGGLIVSAVAISVNVRRRPTCGLFIDCVLSEL
jgi:hypothetical protein